MTISPRWRRLVRPGWLWICLTTLCMVSACGSEEDSAAVTLTADGPEVVIAPPPVKVEAEHDGTVVLAGHYPVEVVPHASGQVYAYVLGDAPPPTDVELTIEVPVARRTTGRPVRMRWNPRDARYEGRVRRVEIVEGPLEVVIVVGGLEYHGRVDVYVLLPAIEVRTVHRRGKYKHKHKHKHKHRHRRRGWAPVVEIR